MAKNNPGSINRRRVAIVDGLRTPFFKSGTAYRDVTTLDLGAAVVNEMLQRANLCEFLALGA